MIFKNYDKTISIMFHKKMDVDLNRLNEGTYEPEDCCTTEIRDIKITPIVKRGQAARTLPQP